MDPPATRVLTWRRKLFFSLVIFLMAALIIEGGLHLVVFILAPEKRVEDVYIEKFYQGKEWAQELFRETDRSKEYHQYLGWISFPSRGKYVNVDAEAGRKTWNPENLPQDATKIFFFGGSAAWGYGSRDDYTVPSHLSRLLNSDQPLFRVYNYGEPAYTFTQGLLYLILKLREGYRPQYVIFYDGYNDIFGSYQSGRAGTVHNRDRTSHKLRAKAGQLHWEAIKDWCRENIFLYNKIYYKIYLLFHPEARYTFYNIYGQFNPEERVWQVGTRSSDQELQALAADTVQYYAQSLKVLVHLSKTYNFKFLCFWQPVLFTDPKVLPQEYKIDSRLEDQMLGKLYRFTNQDLSRLSLPHFYNLADVMSGRTKPLYMDTVHLMEEGNALVAEHIYQVVKREWLPGKMPAVER